MKSTNVNKQGFTLVELSIVLVIIGLLIGGILIAQSMIGTAKLQRLIRDVDQYQTAIRLFQNQYQYLPGDYPDGETFGAADDGNGDGHVDDASGAKYWAIDEQLIAWQELSAANMVPDQYTGTGSTIIAGVNVPKTINGGGIDFGGNHNDGPYDYTLQVGADKGETTEMGYQMGGFMSPDDAFAVDAKIDDGKSESGLVIVGDNNNGYCYSDQTSSYYAVGIHVMSGGSSVDLSRVCALKFLHLQGTP